jgi:hypothetical protein
VNVRPIEPAPIPPMGAPKVCLQSNLNKITYHSTKNNKIEGNDYYGEKKSIKD